MPQSRPSQLRANKVYYEKNREQICKNSAAKYRENCDEIKRKRRERYARKKAEKMKQLIPL
jgi:hypothetical protein